MTSRQVFVLCRRTLGVQVVPAVAGSESSDSILRIRDSASCTASSVQRQDGGRGGGGGMERPGKEGEEVERDIEGFD